MNDADKKRLTDQMNVYKPNIKPPDKPKCELCGSDVKVVGNTTLHYEPVSKPRVYWIKKTGFHDGHGNSEAVLYDEPTPDTIHVIVFDESLVKATVGISPEAYDKLKQERDSLSDQLTVTNTSYDQIKSELEHGKKLMDKHHADMMNELGIMKPLIKDMKQKLESQRQAAAGLVSSMEKLLTEGVFMDVIEGTKFIQDSLEAYKKESE